MERLRASGEREEAVKVPSLPTPFQPPLSQFIDHSVTRFPYQSWCPYCVEGRGREFGHQTTVKESSATQTTSFDCGFLSDGDEVETREVFEAAGDGAIEFLVFRHNKGKAIFGHGVPKKGIDEKGFSVDSLVEDVE